MQATVTIKNSEATMEKIIRRLSIEFFFEEGGQPLFVGDDDSVIRVQDMIGETQISFEGSVGEFKRVTDALMGVLPMYSNTPPNA